MNHYEAASEYFTRNDHEGVTIVEEDYHGPYHVNVDKNVGYVPYEEAIGEYLVLVEEHKILGPENAYLRLTVEEMSE